MSRKSWIVDCLAWGLVFDAEKNLAKTPEGRRAWAVALSAVETVIVEADEAIPDRKTRRARAQGLMELAGAALAVETDDDTRLQVGIIRLRGRWDQYRTLLRQGDGSTQVADDRRRHLLNSRIIEP